MVQEERAGAAGPVGESGDESRSSEKRWIESNNRSMNYIICFLPSRNVSKSLEERRKLFRTMKRNR